MWRGPGAGRQESASQRNSEIPVVNLQTAFDNRKHITRRIRPTVYSSPNSVYGCCHQHSTSPSLSSDCQMLLPLSVTGLDRRVPYVNNTYITNGNDFISDGKSWNANIDERINFESCWRRGMENRVVRKGGE